MLPVTSERIISLARAASMQDGADTSLLELAKIFGGCENFSLRLLICDILDSLKPKLYVSNIPGLIQQNFYRVLNSTDSMARALTLRVASILIPVFGLDTFLASKITDALQGDVSQPEYKMAVQCLPHAFAYFESGSISTKALLFEILTALVS
jgi:hypothetical protein